MFPDPWTQNNRLPQQTWYGVSRGMPHIAVLRRLAGAYPSAARTVPGVGILLGPVTPDGHDVTWRHYGLRRSSGGSTGGAHDDTYWWCISDTPGGLCIGQKLWSDHARVVEILAGFRTPRSRTGLVRVQHA